VPKVFAPIDTGLSQFRFSQSLQKMAAYSYFVSVKR